MGCVLDALPLNSWVLTEQKLSERFRSLIHDHHGPAMILTSTSISRSIAARNKLYMSVASKATHPLPESEL